VRAAIVLSLVAGLLGLGGCAPAAPAAPAPASTAPPVPGLPQGELSLRRDGATLLRLRVSIAESPAAQERGLMGIHAMSDGAGMVFLMPAPSRRAFWMKDTLIPLDVAFWDAGGAVVDVIQMRPCRADPCPVYTPRADYTAAAEVNLGLLERYGVRAGDSAVLSRS
jgi:uncharacterized membrane protein (UPF0127 family)